MSNVQAEVLAYANLIRVEEEIDNEQGVHARHFPKQLPCFVGCNFCTNRCLFLGHRRYRTKVDDFERLLLEQLILRR